MTKWSLPCGCVISTDGGEVTAIGCSEHPQPFIIHVPWKPMDEEQAIDRVRRGTDEDVKVFRLKANGEVDEAIGEALAAKGKLP